MHAEAYAGDSDIISELNMSSEVARCDSQVI